MVDIGQFRDKIIIKYPVKTPNASGGYTESLETVVVTRAYVEKKDGYRKFDEGIDGIINVYEMTCYFSNVLFDYLDKDTMIEWDGSLYRMENWDIKHNERYYVTFTVSELI